VQTGEAHIAGELTCAYIFFLAHIAPHPESPWLPERTPAQLKFHERLWKVAPKAFPTLYKLDFQYLGPLVAKLGGSNAYRVLARRDRSA
jgi:hypothetical protein